MTQYICGEKVVIREDVVFSLYFRTSPLPAQELIQQCAGKICCALGMESLSRLVRIVPNTNGSCLLGSVCVPVAYVKKY